MNKLALILFLAPLTTYAQMTAALQNGDQCLPQVVDGFAPKGTIEYTASSDCNNIEQSEFKLAATFSFAKLSSIKCGNKEYLLVNIYSPGHTPNQGIMLLDSKDLIFPR